MPYLLLKAAERVVMQREHEEATRVKLVELDEACRKQQQGEGWFPTLADVPTHAITLTVPAIMRAKAISCVVPDERKAPAVRDALHAPLGEACPATILRTHPDLTLWLDPPAASLLDAASLGGAK